jgi:hypothetical protein
VFTTMKTDTNAAMRKDAIAQFHAAGLTGVEEGRAWLKGKQLNDTTSGIKWYDEHVMSDFWGMMEKFTTPGQAYTIWYMDKHPQTGKSVIRAKQVHRGRSDEDAIKKIDPNAVGNKEALLAAHGQVNAHSDLVTRVLGMVVEGEDGKIVAASPENMIQAYDEGLNNIVSFDPEGDRTKTIEAIYKGPALAASYQMNIMDLGDKLRKKLTKDQMDVLLPQLQEIIRQSDIVGPGDLGLFPGKQEKSVDRWVRVLMQNIEGSAAFTTEAKVAIEEYARKVLTERRTAQKHGLDVEKLQSGLFTENLKQQKIVLETNELLYKRNTFSQAVKATRIVNEIYDDYRNKSGVFAPSMEFPGQPEVSLRTAIETAFVRERIVYNKEDWDALNVKIAAFKKAHAEDQDRVLVNLVRRATQEKTRDEIAEIDRKRDLEGLDQGLRYHPGTKKAWKGEGTQWESDEPVQVINREMESAAVDAGYNQKTARGYAESGAPYVTYQGVGAGQTETHPKLIGQDVLTTSGAAIQASKLSGDLMSYKFYQEVSKVEELYAVVKNALEKGAVHGGQYDHSAIVKFMRVMDDSIVTESEVETIEKNAGFKDRMKNLLVKFETGATLTPTQRGIIANIMEEIMIGLRKRKLQAADSYLDNWINNWWGEKQQPLRPLTKDDIAPWRKRWAEGEIELIDVPHKPSRKGGEHTKTDTSGVSVKDMQQLLIVEDITDLSTGEVIHKKESDRVFKPFVPVEFAQPTAGRDIPLSKTGIFDLSKIPALQWEDNLKAVLNAISPSLSPGDPMIKDLQEAIRKVRAMMGRP